MPLSTTHRLRSAKIPQRRGTAQSHAVGPLGLAADSHHLDVENFITERCLANASTRFTVGCQWAALTDRIYYLWNESFHWVTKPSITTTREHKIRPLWSINCRPVTPGLEKQILDLGSSRFFSYRQYFCHVIIVSFQQTLRRTIQHISQHGCDVGIVPLAPSNWLGIKRKEL